MKDATPKKKLEELPPSMASLHAYWRMPYILASKNEEDHGNPFVKITKTENDAAEYILLRGRFNYIVMNRYPYNAGHLLVLPYREVAALNDLSREERHELIDLIMEAQNILIRGLKPDGFNIGFNFGTAAGAGIPSHLHCHIVPRWNGDTNFMPVISNTRVLPDSMDAIYQRLHSCVEADK